MSLIANSVYKFGPYELDADSVLLRKGEEVIALPPKAFDLLSALVAARGEVVTKEQLLQTVWPDSFVEEGNLSQSIFVLRRKLGQTGDGQDYIQTVPRRGYRFAVPVERVTRDQEAMTPRTSTNEVDLRDEVQQTHGKEAAVQTKRSNWLVWTVPVGAVLAAALVAAALLHSMKTPDAVSSYVPIDTGRNEQARQDGEHGRPERCVGHRRQSRLFHRRFVGSIADHAGLRHRR